MNIYYTDMEGKQWRLLKVVGSPTPGFVIAIRQDGQLVQLDKKRLIADAVKPVE